MSSDLPPLTALVRICEALPQATDTATRRALIRASESVRQLVEHAHHEEQEAEDAGLSIWARRLLQALGEQQLETKLWAKAVRRDMSHTGGTFCEALAELKESGLVEMVKKGVYRRSAEKPESPKIFPNVSVGAATV